VEESGRYRTINRRKWDAGELEYQLASQTHHATVFARLKHLRAVRARQPALHPDAAQTLVDLGPHLFAIQRRGDGQTLLALHNVTDRPVKVAAHVLPDARVRRNVVASTEISGSSRSITLAPYEVAWISD
jgi:sucrose phosphorylase